MFRLFIVPAFLGATALAASVLAAPAQEKGYEVQPLQLEDIGELSGPQTLRVVMLQMQPGATIPEHVHAGPGLRYVVGGAITISDTTGAETTYAAGETYFEGPGANHPAGKISARGAADWPTSVLIFEVLPK